MRELKKFRGRRWCSLWENAKQFHNSRFQIPDLPRLVDKQYSDFTDEVHWLIKDFNHEKIVFFAWLCAVRALPFLGITRGFEYFKEEDKQKYLMWIFRTLDVAIACTDTAVTDDLNPNCNIFDAFDIILQSHNYLDVQNPILAVGHAADTAFIAKNAVDVAGCAFNVASGIYTPYVEAYVDNCVDMSEYACCDDYATACSVAIAEYATNNPDNILVFMKNNIMGDIYNIKASALHKLNNDTSIYGDMWHHFITDLRAVGCGYWAGLYEDLFDNGFVINRAELKRRLSVPDGIRKKGASDVGLYLENLKPVRGSLPRVLQFV